jgi:hypothetical protein
VRVLLRQFSARLVPSSSRTPTGRPLTSRRPLAAICRAPRQWLVSAFHRPTGAGHGQAYKENLGEAEYQPHYSELEKTGKRARSRSGEMAGVAGVAVKSNRLGGVRHVGAIGITVTPYPLSGSQFQLLHSTSVSPDLGPGRLRQLAADAMLGRLRALREHPASKIASRAIIAALGTNSRRNSNRFAPKELYSAPAVGDA